ncbi:photoreceptor cilium actin regulator [Poeciliopsis prolifica]|uniref:photoreceptor cilium actin regulator n=1 Tax=Poeciliopsis prolifica TaxID=188132 RepID=UPI0024132FAC|nr:photoreceptor cilium actin regulator [Poeciliopsis prolifica]
MGCSPSKGKLFSKPHQFDFQNALVTEELQEVANGGPALDEDTCLQPPHKEEELPLLTDEYCSKETSVTHLDPDPILPENENDSEATRMNEKPQKIIGNIMEMPMNQKVETRKKNMKKRSTERQRKSSIVQTKVSLPPHMVRAHQAAYNFLNQNISKYEILLGLLDQATQTQLSLQTPMSALALYFEEINQALEEMAEEGELMLKEHGDSMTLPSGMFAQAVCSAKPVDNFDPSPDLLHQLLQDSSEKIRQVKISVKTRSDTTLEEGIDYFSSLSKLYSEKLQAKQTAEFRLAQVLAKVETVAIKKSYPEDSALHSEDSGIGGESESLTGSEKNHGHRGSAGSGSCGSEVNIRGIYQNYSAGFVSSTRNNEEEEEEDEERHAKKYQGDEIDQFERKRSNSSPPDPCHTLRHMYGNSMKDQQPAFKQLFNAEHHKITEQQHSQMELDEKMYIISEMQGLTDFVKPQCNLYEVGHRRYSLDGSAGEHKCQDRANRLSGSLSSPSNKPLKCYSVRRLINTFSQGVDGRPGQSLSQTAPHIIRPNKSCIFLESRIVNKTGDDIVSGNNSSSSPDGRADLDMDNLPPPPLEVLMDNSFRRNEDRLQNEKLHEDPVLTLPLIHQTTGISQRRKIVMQNVEVLPNKANVKIRSMAASPAPPVRHEGATELQHQKLKLETDLSEQTEKTKRIYKQARTIIHLRNAGESTDIKNVQIPVSRDLTSLQAARCESNEIPSCSLPIIAPPVSRVRLPPSCPTVHHTVPHPPVFRQHPNSGSSSRPNSPRKVTHANDNSTEQIIPHMSFHDARSVFCQNELKSSQSCLSFGSSVLPRKWGEISRGRLSTRGRENSTRRTQSEQRPGITSFSDLETDAHLVTQQTKEDEPVAEKHSLDNSLKTEEKSEVDPAAEN